MIMGFRVTQLIYVAAKLGIADQLRLGPQSVDALAGVSGAHPRALYRLLRAIASIGIFEETDEGCFHLTPLAELLQTEAARSFHALATLCGDESYYRAYGALLHSIMTGNSAFQHVHGQTLFEYLDEHPDAGGIFNQVMTAYSEQENAAILGAYDFSCVSRVVDVGGGHGRLIAAILGAHTQARGILFDQAPVVEGARDFIAQVGLETRCERIAGDFCHSVPAGGDLYMLKSIIHDWDDETAIAILRRCRAVMKSQARLVLVERVVPPGNGPSEAKLFDINMLMVLGGCERTEAEYKNLLRAAGFRMTDVIPTRSPLSLIKGVPAYTASQVVRDRRRKKRGAAQLYRWP
jgi:O-methyltransferase domain/Dimerisation domain